MTLQEIIDEIPNLSKDEIIVVGDAIVESLMSAEEDSGQVYLNWKNVKEEYLLEKHS